MTVVSLYGGDIQIKYNPSTHVYRLGKERLLSVTGVLGTWAKPALIPWAVKLAVDFLENLRRVASPEEFAHARAAHRKSKEESAGIGTAVHEWIERFIKTDDRTLPNDPRVLNGIIAFLKWVDTHHVKFLESERIVFSRRYRYVGTLDARAEVDGRVCAIDFKTSKSARLEHAVQVAAYRAAYEEEHGPSFTGDNIVVRFDKETGDFHVATYHQQKKDFQVFLALLTVKRREVESTQSGYVPKYDRNNRRNSKRV